MGHLLIKDVICGQMLMFPLEASSHTRLAVRSLTLPLRFLRTQSIHTQKQSPVCSIISSSVHVQAEFHSSLVHLSRVGESTAPWKIVCLSNCLYGLSWRAEFILPSAAPSLDNLRRWKYSDRRINL